MKRVKIDSLIERVLTEEPENLKTVWWFFCRCVYDPIVSTPYSEIGARMSRGKIIKKYHNCFSIVNSQAPYTFSYVFLGRDKNSAVKNYAIQVEYNCFNVDEICLLNSKLQPILDITLGKNDKILIERFEK